MYEAVLLGVQDREQFRMAKRAAVERLQTDGFDPCLIGVWQTTGPTAPALEPTGRRDLPLRCAPRIVAADEDARARLGEIRAIVDRVSELTASQLGWRPQRPLTVLEMTDAEAALSIYRRFNGGAASEQLARSGRSIYLSGTAHGGLMLINLSQRDFQLTFTKAMHEYTHFA